MDKEQGSKKDGTAEDELDGYHWLAASLVMGFIILMLVVIAGIILWRYFKKKNTTDQNWAGRPPMIDGNIQEDGSINMDASILGRSMSLSGISTSPILSNDPQTALNGDLEEDTIERKPTSTATISTPIPPPIANENTGTSPPAPEIQPYTRLPENYKTFLPPPPSMPQEFPMPPPNDEFAEPDLGGNHMQPPPPLNPHQQEYRPPFALNQEISLIGKMDTLHNTYNYDDQLLPPPPADLL